MITTADIFRPYWAYGINNVILNKSRPLSTWVGLGKDYQVYKQAKTDEFQLSTQERNRFLEPISHDCNRFLIAAFESILQTQDFKNLPKSAAWKIIKSYYSAFYSAHFLLRVLGISLTQLDRNAINMVEKIAAIYGTLNSTKIEKGFYIADFTSRTPDITFSKAREITDTGSHGILWKTFSERISFISNDIISKHTSAEYQVFSAKLSDIAFNLKFNGNNSGNWLSTIRNEVNYKHLHQVWFPYKNQDQYFNKINTEIESWKKDLTQIDLTNYVGKDLLRFFSTCSAIVSIAKSVCMDLSQRCSAGKSFCFNGGISLLSYTKLV